MYHLHVCCTLNTNLLVSPLLAASPQSEPQSSHAGIRGGGVRGGTGPFVAAPALLVGGSGGAPIGAPIAWRFCGTTGAGGGGGTRRAGGWLAESPVLSAGGR